MNYDVTVKTIPERYAATVHTVIPRYEDEGMAWGYMSEIGPSLVPADPCLAAAEFRRGAALDQFLDFILLETHNSVIQNRTNIENNL